DSAIIPADFCKELIKQIGKHNEDVTITTTPKVGVRVDPETLEEREYVESSRSATFTSAHLSLTSRIIEGTFPEVRQLIPTVHVTEVRIATERLLPAVKRAALFAKQNNDVLVLTTDTLDASRLQVSANAAEIGDAIETITAGTFTGTPMRIAFNQSYLVDVLTAGKPDNVTLRFKGPNNAGVVIPHTDSLVQVDCVIMPMHLAQ
ncbi:MAG: DNA polymerase III subunit beta, partial [Thermomicrobia bacterium]|nr:DNA polymerase III subunit beta [Thermomicrobia bacterium]